MKLNPEGRGMYIWKLYNLYGGDFQLMLKAALYMKLDWVCVKILNGKCLYNYYNGKHQVEELVKVFHGAGIEVHGWQWVLMEKPANEAKAAVQVCNDLGLKGFVMDIEAPCKNAPANSVITYTQGITALDIPVGFSSYRYPTYHQEILYDAYLDVCTYIAPQVYWQPSHNPAFQLEKSRAEYAAMDYGHMPFIPTGSAYEEWGNKPLNNELIAFNQGVIEAKDPGLSWWRFGSAIDLGFHHLIAKMPNNYGGVEPIQPPPPPPKTHFRVSANLNVRDAASTQGKDVGTLKEGSDITIVERSGIWGKIQGWVHTDYLEPL